MSTTTKVSNRPRLEPRRVGHWIDDWRPEDPVFWNEQGATIARRNLIYSVASEHVGFSVWTLWSVLVLFLGPNYGFDVGQKFLLTAVPSLLGAFVRVPYTFAVAVFGGRNWTVISAALLLIPTVAIAIVLQPGVSFTTLLWVSALAGVGGGNFASSMTNINAFFPSRLKGWALGVNAGGGNLGVAVAQLVGLLVLGLTGTAYPRMMVAIYIPLIVVVAVLAAVKMDNLTQVSNAKGAMREVAKHKESWVLAVLYIGTFGSFIGFSFAFGQVLLVQFPKEFPNPATAAALTFMGPLLGSLIRPIGGKLADRYTGSLVTFWNFLAMAFGTLVVLGAALLQSLPLFVAGFILLFVFSGLGNGSTYKMIPAIFMAKAQLRVGAGMPIEEANAQSLRRSGALIGLAGAIGALGGFGVNLAFRQSFLSTGNANGAYLAFIGFYVICMIATWAWFMKARPGRLDGV